MDELLPGIFNEFGEVKSIDYVRGKYSGMIKGAAYITYATSEQAKAALAADGKMVYGRGLSVKPAREDLDEPEGPAKK